MIETATIPHKILCAVDILGRVTPLENYPETEKLDRFRGALEEFASESVEVDRDTAPGLYYITFSHTSDTDNDTFYLEIESIETKREDKEGDEMHLLVTVTYFVWDNYRGGSGAYNTNDIGVRVPVETKAEDVMKVVRDRVEEHLSQARPFDQTVYSKEQKEYVINAIKFIL